MEQVASLFTTSSSGGKSNSVNEVVVAVEHNQQQLQ
jgi:hypothetical protein